MANHFTANPSVGRGEVCHLTELPGGLYQTMSPRRAIPAELHKLPYTFTGNFNLAY